MARRDRPFARRVFARVHGGPFRRRSGGRRLIARATHRLGPVSAATRWQVRNPSHAVPIGAFAAKVFGTSNDRRLKAYRPHVEAINALERELERLSDAELRARTEAFRKQLQDGAELDDLLVPAFATVREAAKRTLGQRHFDVQLIGGMVLHEGKISEMKTGEGKTLVATLPVYLNALAGKGVHVVTVNDYLAKRDSEWMGRVYKFLGLTVGCIVHELNDEQRGPVRLRRHLRHQQRAGLRLPARQHEDARPRDGAARARLRHRRRGRLDPDRRGAHPADHLRPRRGPRRSLHRRRRADEAVVAEHDTIEKELETPTPRRS